ncbi:putative hydroxymethylpyrimidine transporter CytX, partial [Mesorhizobium sp. M00.F.Ca.ET.216.01.1.1]
MTATAPCASEAHSRPARCAADEPRNSNKTSSETSNTTSSNTGNKIGTRHTTQGQDPMTQTTPDPLTGDAGSTYEIG